MVQRPKLLCTASSLLLTALFRSGLSTPYLSAQVADAICQAAVAAAKTAAAAVNEAVTSLQPSSPEALKHSSWSAEASSHREGLWK